MSAKTLYDKLWDEHLVIQRDDGSALIYIDRQLLHEVTSPQAFESISLQGRNLWRKEANLAVPDHNVPTEKGERSRGVEGIEDPISRLQVETLNRNCEKAEVQLIEMNDIRQGIVHVVGPEQGFTQPGMTIVCGDSHTSTHGALGAMAQGVGTSEVEHVLTTGCLVQKKLKNMLISYEGEMAAGITPKDLVLYTIGRIGTAGGTGYAIEFGGPVMKELSVEGRMTICNMSIEAGARVGLVGVDETTIAYLKDRPYAPKGELWERAADYWRGLVSDRDAHFDRIEKIDVSQIRPQVTWGTSPEMVCSIEDGVPEPGEAQDKTREESYALARKYMGLEGGERIIDLELDRVFIGSCTNSRIEDLRAAAAMVKGRTVSSRLKQAMVVPGSGLVKQQAEAEGLHQIFTEAGFEWREPGCSMCLAMNSDKLKPGERCASTSNRNFESRQGYGGRTHLVSPAMAAAAAVAGHFVDIRTWQED